MGYAEFGEEHGSPLVFCHGFPSSRLSAALLHAEARAVGMRVIAPDRPGYGLSDFKRLRRVRHWATDLTSLVDALGLDRFAVVGVSTGAPYAAACAALLPQRVRAAGIVSGWAPPNAPRAKPGPRLPFVPALGRHVRLLRRFSLSRVAKRLERDASKFLDRATRNAPPADRTVLADATVRGAIVDDLREALRQGARGPAREARIINRRWGIKLEDIRVPVWLWHGQDDRNVPPELARFVSEQIPGSRATLYRADGHLSTFIAHIGEILRAVKQGRG
jgi:pimeloyl-ACP methyl ester carboxylesterase